MVIFRHLICLIMLNHKFGIAIESTDYLNKNRLHTLDYLRGLAAFSIMFYHFSTWTFGVYSSNNLLGRIGLYGVSIFYVLSGLTLFLVYFNKNDSFIYFAKKFFIRRAFRILPLLWLTILLTILIMPSPIDRFIFFLNVSGLFGIVDCNISIARGGWSIGNEIAFYIFFAFFILTSKNFKIGFYILSFLIFFVFIWFAFYYINDNSTIEAEWSKYINPLNQVMLFLSGYLIGFFLSRKRVSRKVNLIILFSAILVFCLLPVRGERIVLITDHNRLIFSLLCILLCFSVYKIDNKFPRFIHRPLSTLGEMSYSVYLLHPVFWASFERLFKHYNLNTPTWLNMLVSIPSTLIGSYIVYNTLEKFFMKKGREFSVNQIRPVNSDHKTRLKRTFESH